VKTPADPVNVLRTAGQAERSAWIKMTLRNEIKERLQVLGDKKQKANRMFFAALICLGVLTVISIFPIPMWFKRILFPINIVAMILFIGGWTKSYKATASLHKKTPCPSCGKNLSYLLSDKNYSKCNYWKIPTDFPEGMDNCPYCKESFDNEKNLAEPEP